jgi:hypothetical protein
VKRKDDTVSSYNPGQYYAVSTVEVLDDVETLTITEDFSNCTLDEGLSALNPPAGRGGGSVAIIEVDADGVAAQIANAKSANVQVTDEAVVATLDDVPAGSTILMYVKFGPGLKGEVFPGAASCENETTVETANTIASDTATLHVLEK